MNQRLRQLDSEVINCRMSFEYLNPSRFLTTIFHAQPISRYGDCGGKAIRIGDMIFTQDLPPLFEVGFKNIYQCKPTTTDGFNAGLLVIDRVW